MRERERERKRDREPEREELFEKRRSLPQLTLASFHPGSTLHLTPSKPTVRCCKQVSWEAASTYSSSSPAESRGAFWRRDHWHCCWVYIMLGRGALWRRDHWHCCWIYEQRPLFIVWLINRIYNPWSLISFALYLILFLTGNLRAPNAVISFAIMVMLLSNIM